MLFLQASIVFWLQTLRYWWENNTLFIVDVSRVYANSSSEDRKETIWNVHTHTAFLKIKKIRIYNFHESNIKFHLHSLKVSANVKIVMQCFETFLGEMPPPLVALLTWDDDASMARFLLLRSISTGTRSRSWTEVLMPGTIGQCCFLYSTFVLNSLLTSMFICISVYLYNADSAVMRDLRL